MIDGRIETSEWEDAAAISIDPENVLLIKEDRFYYYMALKSELPKPLYVDMFFQLGDSVINIHASTQLGDRTLRDTSWTDSEPETRWGHNRDWIANTVKFDAHTIAKLRQENFQGNIYANTYMPYDGMEFQFSKRSWPLDKSLVRIEIRNMTGSDGFESVIFPASSQRKQSSGWYTLDWSR